MLSKKITDKKKASPKESMIIDISSKLSSVLITFKDKLGEKKFEKRIRKAAKLIMDGIKFTPAKKRVATKLPAKSNEKKATASIVTKKQKDKV